MGLLDRLKKRNLGSDSGKFEDGPVEGFVESAPEEELSSFFLQIDDETLTPSGLYPHEVLILDQASSFYTDQGDFPSFWRQRYGILHMPLSLSLLVSRGLLAEASLEAAMERTTVVGLRAVLKANGLRVGGKKAELIARLFENLSPERLDVHFPRRSFVLTEAGIQALGEAPYIPYLHTFPVEGLTIWDLHRQVLANPGKPYRELILAHLEEASQAGLEGGDYAAYRALRYRMYQFFMEENKLKKAFPFLSEVIYCDLSGAASGFDPLYRYISEKYFFPYDTSSLRLSAGVIRAMGRLQEDLHLSEEMLGSLLLQFFQRCSLPFHLFSKKECAIIVVLELRGDTERLRQLYQMAESRFGKG